MGVPLLIDLNMQFLKLFGVDFSRRLGHQIGRFLRLREGDAVANVLQFAKQHHPAIESQRDSAVGWSAETESVEQMPELNLLSFLVDATRTE